MRIKKVCEKCGSEYVWVDAAAEWDTDTQSWELGNMWDYSHCGDCDIIITKLLIGKEYHEYFKD